MKQPKPYQIDGGKWLSARRSALLADEPRVGKTFSAIIAADRVRAALVIVVCPAHVKENWRREIGDCQRGGWVAVIVSYAKLGDFLKRLPFLIRIFEPGPIAVIIDESHYAKERSAQRTKHLYGPTCSGVGGVIEHAQFVWCLTGTPMPNNAMELYPMLRALAPELILNERGRPLAPSSYESKFVRKMATPFGAKTVGTKNYAQLKKLLSDFVLRRKRKDVFGRDLQPPTRFYVRPATEFRSELAALEGSEMGARVKRALEAGGLKGLMKEEKHVAPMRKMIGLAKVPGVAAVLKDELRDEPDKKIVLFAFHHAVIDALRDTFKQYGALVYDGRTPMARKPKIEDLFRTNKKHRVVIGQLTAMNVGIDLSAANDVVFVEQSWTDTENEQARSRIFNLNKDEPCFTRFAVLSGSLDESIIQACERKLTDSRKVFS